MDWAEQVKRVDCKQCKFANLCGDIFPNEGKCPANSGAELWAKFTKGKAIPYR